MKTITFFLISIFLSANLVAQSPEKMSYQAVIRDANDALIKSSTVSMKISLLQGSSSGTAVYVETQSAQTNSNGLLTVEIGNGTLVSGSISTIDWANGPYYIKTQTDPNGGTSYTLTTTSQLMSVPYALYATTSETATTANVHSVGESYGGGVVFYVYDSGRHGLIAAKSDVSTGVRWYGGSNTNTCAKADNGIGSGLKNTAIIIANQGAVDGSTFAARLCNEYFVNSGGVNYADWYLPSAYELALLYAQKATVGGFTSNQYWSSTELDDNDAYYVDFSSGSSSYKSKYILLYVRAIRAF